MEIHIESAVTCSELLLELTGIKLSKDIVLPSGQPIDARIKALNKCYGVRLKQKKLKYAALLEREIPLAFLSPDGVPHTS